jgi:flagellar biosynthesis GTPase FlhF
LISQNNLIEARRIITIGKGIFPNNVLIYIEASNLYINETNIELAIVEIEKAISFDPKSEIAHYHYGLILHQKYDNASNDEDFEEYYKKTSIQYMYVLSINMENTETLCNYGAVIAKYANKYTKKSNQLFEKSTRKIKNVPLEFKRYLFDRIYKSNRLIAVKGARGTGKTTLLLQLAYEHKADEVLYIALDDLFFSEN